jgi:hypothetical protein
VCSIKQFPETIEQLGEEIISLVNRLIKIIHQVGAQWDGSPTNNYGDHYILTWRLPSEDHHRIKAEQSAIIEEQAMQDGMMLESGMPGKSPLPHAPWIKNEVDEFEDLVEADIPKKRSELADKALISAVKTIAEIERDQGILAYKRHPRILTRFDKAYKA